MSNRFDYVKYDDASAEQQAAFKAKFQEIEAMVEKLIHSARAKENAMDKLEESYMWIGKGIRNDQVARDGDANDQPHRG